MMWERIFGIVGSAWWTFLLSCITERFLSRSFWWINKLSIFSESYLLDKLRHVSKILMNVKHSLGLMLWDLKIELKVSQYRFFNFLSNFLYLHTGPAFWGLINPEWSLCNKGRRQSPVNLEPQRLLFDPNLRPLHMDKHRVSGLHDK